MRPERGGTATARHEESAAAWQAATEVVIDRLAALAAELEPIERSVLATLLAPVISLGGDEAARSRWPGWIPDLPDGVRTTIHDRNLRAVGLE